MAKYLVKNIVKNIVKNCEMQSLRKGSTNLFHNLGAVLRL